jgi:hypothetical protein
MYLSCVDLDLILMHSFNNLFYFVTIIVIIFCCFRHIHLLINYASNLYFCYYIFYLCIYFFEYIINIKPEIKSIKLD